MAYQHNLPTVIPTLTQHTNNFNDTATLSEMRLCPTLLNVAVTASIISELQSGHPQHCSRVWVFHRLHFNSLLPLLERHAYDGRAWTTVDGRRWTEVIGEGRHASSSTVSEAWCSLSSLPYLRQDETMLFNVRVQLVIRSEVTTNG